VLEQEPESNTADKRDDGDDGVVPDKVRVDGQRDKGLAEGSRDGAHEQVDRQDERLHVLGSLGVGVLVRGDVGEDLGETNQNVGQALGPDVDLGRRAGSRLAVLVNDLLAGVVAAGAHLVDVVLHDGGGNHGEGGKEVTDCKTLDGGEANLELAEKRVQDVVNNGDKDDNGDGVEVLDNVVGDTVTLKGTSLVGQVTRHLVVGQEEDGHEEEDLASHETTANLVDPGVVVGEPGGALGNGNVGGLGSLPVGAAALGVLAGIPEHLKELGQKRAGGGRQPV
jgi:hypothetical protein